MSSGVSNIGGLGGSVEIVDLERCIDIMGTVDGGNGVTSNRNGGNVRGGGGTRVPHRPLSHSLSHRERIFEPWRRQDEEASRGRLLAIATPLNRPVKPPHDKRIFDKGINGESEASEASEGGGETRWIDMNDAISQLLSQAWRHEIRERKILAARRAFASGDLHRNGFIDLNGFSTAMRLLLPRRPEGYRGERREIEDR